MIWNSWMVKGYREGGRVRKKDISGEVKGWQMQFYKALESWTWGYWSLMVSSYL